ncbi:unnamed protein product [Periconia digitata]|uniref:Zn(2)-C6 fungal-type domain-containing protein n=1 Tax=Periconia digitata TaxID=1303443 RepID=A0A9W4UFA8_9PLEO|nr:unnamed protein product [Periconia digitata]
MKKRSRACEECHRLKIKCDVPETEGVERGVCERCNRNNLTCTPAAPRLQRNRIQELETQIEALKTALSEKSSSEAPSTPAFDSPLSYAPHDGTLSFLDVRIPFERQRSLLRKVAEQLRTIWPVVVLQDDLETLRAQSPILLACVLAFCTTHAIQDTELPVHDELVRDVMRILADEVLAKGRKSMELVQALLIATLWSKSTRDGSDNCCYQLAQLATEMAIDLGIGGPSLQPTPPAFFSRHRDATSLEARRTWLACSILLSSASMHIRRAPAVQWDAYHEECLTHLQNDGLPSDALLCEIVRIHQLMQETSDRLCHCQSATFVDANNYDTHATIDLMKNKVNTWAAQVPDNLASSQILKLWHHVAMVHIHEVVLHTPTNKFIFAAPYIPMRIPTKDFPKPALCIPPLSHALHALIEHCHAVLDIVSRMDPAVVLELPTFCFAPVVLYTLFVLVTVFVTATDPTNTYGRYLARERFLIEHYGAKMLGLRKEVIESDPMMSCYTTRMIDATSWLGQWYDDYNVIIERYQAQVSG